MHRSLLRPLVVVAGRRLGACRVRSCRRGSSARTSTICVDLSSVSICAEAGHPARCRCRRVPYSLFGTEPLRRRTRPATRSRRPRRCRSGGSVAPSRRLKPMPPPMPPPPPDRPSTSTLTVGDASGSKIDQPCGVTARAVQLEQQLAVAHVSRAASPLDRPLERPPPRLRAAASASRNAPHATPLLATVASSTLGLDRRARRRASLQSSASSSSVASEAGTPSAFDERRRARSASVSSAPAIASSADVMYCGSGFGLARASSASSASACASSGDSWIVLEVRDEVFDRLLVLRRRRPRHPTPASACPAGRT